MKKIFGKRLRQERERRKKEDKKWTQQYVAELLNVTRTAYNHYENGESVPPSEGLLKLSELFDVSIDYLLGKTDQPNYNDPESSQKYELDEEVEEVLNMLNSLPESERKKLSLRILGYIDAKSSQWASRTSNEN
ncbi:MAG TPA: helix-turn-helix transcriptional regulator [Bacillus sp. (in: firmicutes)]|nr:helix-turn-helix transcriptional regulator [Bacillus sp. (in: firmicutes)]